MGAPALLEDPGLERERLLLGALRAGQQAAFSALVREHSGRVMAVVRRILRDEEDARDASQETFLCAFRAIHGFTGASRLSTWLHRIAVNCALMKLRAAAGRPTEPAPEDLPAAPLADGPEARIERKQLGTRLRAAILQLPEGHRMVLLLRDVEELDTEETARQLQISPTNVKVRLHRARATLRRLLEEPAIRPAPAAD